MHVHLEAALRVLSCYRDSIAPNPEDLRVIREMAADDEPDVPADDLAVEVVNAELHSLTPRPLSKIPPAA